MKTLHVLVFVLILLVLVMVASFVADELRTWSSEALDHYERPQMGEPSGVVMKRLPLIAYDGRVWGEPETDFFFSCANRVTEYDIRVANGVVSEVTAKPRDKDRPDWWYSKP